MLLSCCFQNSTELCEETKKDEKYRYREVKKCYTTLNNIKLQVKYPMKREHKRVLKKKLSNDSSYERPSMKCPKVTDEKDSLDDQHHSMKKNNFWKETSSHIESQNKQKNFTEITIANSVENYGKGKPMRGIYEIIMRCCFRHSKDTQKQC